VVPLGCKQPDCHRWGYIAVDRRPLATRGTAMVILKQNQEEGKNRGPLAALKRMVTIPSKLSMDHLKVHPTSESGKKTERY